MSTNAPPFDPLSPTPEESDDMLRGYLSTGHRDNIKPDLESAAFEHGWRMRRNDLAGVVDDDQKELALRLLSPAKSAGIKVVEVSSPTDGPTGSGRRG